MQAMTDPHGHENPFHDPTEPEVLTELTSGPTLFVDRNASLTLGIDSLQVYGMSVRTLFDFSYIYLYI